MQGKKKAFDDAFTVQSSLAAKASQLSRGLEALQGSDDLLKTATNYRIEEISNAALSFAGQMKEQLEECCI